MQLTKNSAVKSNIVKNIIKVGCMSLLTITSYGFISSVYAENLSENEGITCANKKQIIQTKINEAKQHKNTFKSAGLEKALAEINSSCSDSDLETKYKKRIQDKTAGITKHTQELKEAQLKGDAEKIAKEETKLLKEKAELTEAQNKLAQFYKEVKIK